MGKIPVFCKTDNFFFVSRRNFLISTDARSYIQQGLLYEVRNEAGIRAMINNSSRRIFPITGKIPQLHLPPVKRFFKRALRINSLIRIPTFNRSINVQYIVIMAPLNDFIGADIPG